MMSWVSREKIPSLIEILGILLKIRL